MGDDASGSTDPLADEHAQRRAVDGPYVLVFSARGNELVRLPREGDLFVGRDPAAAIQVADRTVSRRHARLRIAESEVTLIDLGSENGTLLNGERLRASAPVRPGDVIELGGTQIVFGSCAHPRGDGSPDGAIVEAIDRAIRLAQPFSLVLLDGGSTVRDRLAAAIAPYVTHGDVAGCAGTAGVAVVIGPRSAGAARDEAARLLRAIKARLPGVRAGLARFPDEAADSGSLLGAARAACDRARPGAIALADEAVARFTMRRREYALADGVMIRALDLATRLAASDLPVLVHGETGVGKEVFSRLIHERSSRSSAAFVPVNCAALTDASLESELGAANAQGGTLFLDEVAELPPPMQAKLARVLEEMREGTRSPRSRDMRLVAATHRDLPTEVAAGRFRSDLYFRIAGASLFLPPLRDRPRDVTLLARVLLQRIAERTGARPRTVTPSAMRTLASYAWPGNVRELESVIGHAAALAEGAGLDVSALPLPVQRAHPDLVAGRDVGRCPRRQQSLDDEIRELEIQRIREALAACNGVQTRAARLLRMPLRTFQTKVRLYGLRGKNPTRA